MGLWGESEERLSKMVFIGKDLNKDALRLGFTSCLVPEDFKAVATPDDLAAFRSAQAHAQREQQRLAATRGVAPALPPE